MVKKVKNITLEKLAEMIAGGFSETAKKFVDVDDKFTAIDGKFAAIDDKFAVVNARFDIVDNKIDALYYEVKEARRDIEDLKPLTARVTALELRLERLEKQGAKHTNK
jgi:hypothetical protein